MDIKLWRYHILIIHFSSLLSMLEGARSRTLGTLINTRVGEQVTLTCPESAVFVNWYKDGQDLHESEYIRMQDEKLRIKNVTHDDQGIYSCKPIDGYGASGQSQNNFTVIVYSADVSVFPEHPTLHTTTELPNSRPYFLDNRMRTGGTQSMRKNLTMTASFNCAAGGHPSPTVTWFKGNEEMNFRRQNVVDNGQTMKVKDLRLTDAGVYKCRVSNEMGTITYTYSLSVKDPLAAYTEVVSPFPLNTSVNFGSTASLQCKVRSNSKPTIMWLRHVTTPSTVDRDAIINIQDKSYKLIQNDTKQVESEADAYINQLLIHNVGMKDQGIYACIGMDKRGNSDMKEARLVVIPGASTTPTTLLVTTSDSWEMIFGSPSATLAVLIAIPVVIILMITIAIIYGLNKKKKNTASNIRRPPNNMMMDHEVAVPLNMNANNGCYTAQYNGSNGSYNKVPLANSDTRYGGEKMYHPPAYRSPTPQQYSQYMQSDGSYRSSLHYPPIAAVHQQSLRKQQQHSRSQGDEDYMTDIPDSDSHFSSVSHTRPQYMSSNGRNPYDDRDIHSDPPGSRIGLHCPPPPPGSYYSGQW